MAVHPGLVSSAGYYKGAEVEEPPITVIPSFVFIRKTIFLLVAKRFPSAEFGLSLGHE